MGFSSEIKRTWKLCILGSLLVCFVLVLYLNQNGKTLSFLAARNRVQEFSVYHESKAQTILAEFIPHGKSQAPFSSSLSKPPAQPFASHIPMLSSFSSPPAQEFSSDSHSNAPMSNMLAKPRVQQLTSHGQSHTPMSNMMAKPPVQQLISQGQSEVTMSATPMALGQDILSINQSEDLGFSLEDKPPVADILSHDESNASTLSTTFSQPPIRSMINKTASMIPTNELEINPNKSAKRCNLFEGSWVYKPEENPSYDSIKCPFIEEKFSCQKNGRPDNEYEKWSWQPKDCDIPLFNGKDMLERLRNKRVVIVGDSLNRNMWESLACLLYTSIPSSRARVEAKKSDYKVLEAKDYNAVIEFHWSPFLVKYDTKHKSGKNVLVLDKLSSNSKLWRGADVMVFNSAHWWTHTGKYKKWDILQYQGNLHFEGIALEQAYEIGLKTWGKWLKNNVDPMKTMVFFRGVSAQHNGKPHCHDAKNPIHDDLPYENNFPKSLMNVVETKIKGMNKPRAIYLNITKLSEYRMDAHPSVFKSWQGKIYATKYKSLILNYADCSHWCLPGLPDTWNRLLYIMLFFK